MSLFNKMFNFELQAELVRDGDCREAYPVTSTELEWLQQVLQSETASAFLKPETIAKLRRILASYQADAPDILEKASIRSSGIVPPAIFSVLRQAVREKKGVRLALPISSSPISGCIEGWPIWLEFNMARREWYLTWQKISDGKIQFTPLRNICSVDTFEVQDWQDLTLEADRALKQRRRMAVLYLNPDYPADRHRVLSALSAFDRDVEMESDNTYHINLHYYLDEEEYLLQRIRFLGLRIKVAGPSQLIRRMRETAARMAVIYEAEES